MNDRIEMSLEAMTAASDEAAAILRQMSNPSRLLLLCHLVDGARGVSGLMEATGLGQAYVSQQLARLRAEGLVTGERQGREVVYRLADARVAMVIEGLHRAFCADHEQE